MDIIQEQSSHKFMIIPFLNPMTPIITNIKNSQYKIANRLIKRLNKFIKTQKDILLQELLICSNVVYRIYCNDCEASYVGQTKIKISTRINEHKKMYPSQAFIVSEYSLLIAYNFNWDNAEILGSEHSYYKRLISESLHIQLQIFSLNVAQDFDRLVKGYLSIIGGFVQQ